MGLGRPGGDGGPFGGKESSGRAFVFSGRAGVTHSLGTTRIGARRVQVCGEIYCLSGLLEVTRRRPCTLPENSPEETLLSPSDSTPERVSSDPTLGLLEPHKADPGEAKEAPDVRR